MFGFDKVAAFTHEFETAFELVRKGEIKPTQELISVALAAKDYIRALIEAPESTDSIIGEAILDDLRQFVAPTATRGPSVAKPEMPAATAKRLRRLAAASGIRFPYPSQRLQSARPAGRSLQARVLLRRSDDRRRSAA